MRTRYFLFVIAALFMISAGKPSHCKISLFEYVREADSGAMYKNPKNTEVEIKAPNAINLNEVPVTFYHDCPELSFELAVYNRWGSEVFKTVDAGEPWYCEYEGQQLPMGVYMWKLKYKIGKRGDEQERTGNITLLK